MDLPGTEHGAREVRLALERPLVAPQVRHRARGLVQPDAHHGQAPRLRLRRELRPVRAHVLLEQPVDGALVGRLLLPLLVQPPRQLLRACVRGRMQAVGELGREGKMQECMDP